MVSQDAAAMARSLGLSDDSFEQRRPLRGQITKREVRAVSLYLLGVRGDSTVWDIGAGTGSISVEAALIANSGAIFAIERDGDSLDLLRHNVAMFGGPNVHVIHGEAPDVLESLPSADSVFVGGSGGNLSRILDESVRRLNPGGRIVVNLAALERTLETYQGLKNKGMDVELTSVSASRGKEMPDGAVRLEALNPVFIVSAKKPEAGE